MSKLSITIDVHGTGSVLPAGSDINASLGSTAIAPSTLRVSWGGVTQFSDALVTMTNADSLALYGAGIVRFSPSSLPAKGTEITVEFDAFTQIDGATNCSSEGGFLGDLLIKPGSLRFFADVTFGFKLKTADITTTVKLADVDLKTITQPVLIVDQPPTGSPAPGIPPEFPQLTGYPNLGYLLYYINGARYCAGFVDYQLGTIDLVNDNSNVYTYLWPAYPKGPTFRCEITTGGITTAKDLTWVELEAITTQAFKKPWFSPQTVTGIKYATTDAEPKTVTVAINSLGVSVPVPSGATVQGVQFNVGGTRYVQQADGTVVSNPSGTTGAGTTAGSITSSTGAINIDTWDTGASSGTTAFQGVLAVPDSGENSPYTTGNIIMRTATAPLRPSSFSVSGYTAPYEGNTEPGSAAPEGVWFQAYSDADGILDTDYVKGRIDYESGIVDLWFCNPVPPPNTGGPVLDLSFLQIPGVTTVYPGLARTASLRYNAVSYSYLPLDADILGIDPVRLPSDGRVPIFRPGGFAVVGHTGEITATVSNAQVIDCARVRLSRVRVIGNDGVVINTGYTTDLEAGTVTFTDVSGYSQPVTVQHRIEDMAIVRETQINGEISFTRQLTHDYPVPGSYVSSALIAGGNGDMFARVSVLFDQATWNGTYADVVSGSPATGTFNAAQYPIAVTNRGARTERWVVQFTSSTAFNLIGENVGVIAVGTINSNCAPLNPATSVPYFTIPALGWGSGWATGNVLRFNTVGAEFPVWVVRTVQQGPETVPNDSFTILIRGDVNA